MTITQLYQILEQSAPRALSADWDNDGIACLVDPEKAVSRVLVALDATKAAVEYAVSNHFDVLLTHHPLLFRGVKALTPAHCVPRKLLQLALGGVAAISLHTRLDAAKGGVNDVLAARLGLTDVRPFAPEGEVPYGRIGKLPAPVDVSAFAHSVCRLLGAPAVNLVGKGEVQTVAVLGGEGGDFVDAARAAGAELLVSGRIGYHRMLDAAEEGLCVMEAGHFYTERPVLWALADLVKAAERDITVQILDKPGIQTVCE